MVNKKNPALLLTLLAGTIYYYASYPSISFWDSGEYTATILSAGIPHPPGNPFYILTARVFSIIFFFVDKQFVTTFFSIIVSSFSVFLFYHLIDKTIKRSFSSLNHMYRTGIASVFTLFFAFSYTTWKNAGETEVYGFALIMALLCASVFQCFFFERNSKRLFLFFYLYSLSISVHQMFYIILPLITLFFLFDRDFEGLLLFTPFLTFLIGLPFSWSALIFIGLFHLLYFFLEKRLKHINIYLIISLLITSAISWKLFLIHAVTLLMILSLLKAKNNQKKLKPFFLLALFTFLGLTPQLYTPIRASLEPAINMGAPKNFQAFQDYYSGNQYRHDRFDFITKRKGAFANQLSMMVHYMKNQFHSEIIYILFFGLCFSAALYTFRRNKNNFYLLCAILFILIFAWTYYLNLSDGTMGLKKELRSRDDFYIFLYPFFYFLSALGFSYIINILVNRIYFKVFAATLVVLLAVAIPYSIKSGSVFFNRRHNISAKFFSRDIIDHCFPNTILFTNGDNDTYPLWAFLKIFGNEKNIVPINLGLLNTRWYAEETVRRLKLPLSQNELDNLFAIYPRAEKQPIIKSVSDREIHVSGAPINKKLSIITVSHILTLEIINRFSHKTPIAFSRVVSPESIPFSTDSLNSYGVINYWNNEPTLLEQIDKLKPLFSEKHPVFSRKEILTDPASVMIFNVYADLIRNTYEKTMEQYPQKADQLRKAIEESVFITRWPILSFLIKNSIKNHNILNVKHITEKIDRFENFIEHDTIYFKISKLFFQEGIINTGLNYLKKALIINPHALNYYKECFSYLKKEKDRKMILEYAKHYLPSETLLLIREEAKRP